MHWTLEVREPWATELQGVPKKITLLKFIYNWTKIKEGFEKNRSKT